MRHLLVHVPCFSLIWGFSATINCLFAVETGIMFKCIVQGPKSLFAARVPLFFEKDGRLSGSSIVPQLPEVKEDYCDYDVNLFFFFLRFQIG